MSAEHWVAIIVATIPAVASVIVAYLGRGGHDDDAE
jgi:hypothetical protein